MYIVCVIQKRSSDSLDVMITGSEYSGVSTTSVSHVSDLDGQVLQEDEEVGEPAARREETDAVTALRRHQLAQLEQQLSAMLDRATRAREAAAGSTELQLQEALNHSAQMRTRHETEVKELKEEMKCMRKALKTKSLQLERAVYLQQEAFARFENVVLEFGELSRQIKREMSLLRNNVGRAVSIAFVRGKGGAACAALVEAERFGQMPLSAELLLREETIELLTLDLAVLSHDATLHQIAIERKLKAQSEEKLQELSRQRQSHKPPNGLGHTPFSCDDHASPAERRCAATRQRMPGPSDAGWMEAREAAPSARAALMDDKFRTNDENEFKEAERAMSFADCHDRHSTSACSNSAAQSAQSRVSDELDGLDKLEEILWAGQSSSQRQDVHEIAAEMRECAQRAASEIQAAISFLMAEAHESQCQNVSNHEIIC